MNDPNFFETPATPLEITRRHLLGRTAGCLGAAAWASLAGRSAQAAASAAGARHGLPGLPHFRPTAKRVIYLFQSGGPSHVERFDHHPMLRKRQGTELPA
jgi:hypothetical protein